MLKSMMASAASSSSTSTAPSSIPTYESIQRQLDEMRLKALKVEEEQDEGGVRLEPQSVGAAIKKVEEEHGERGVLLDSGSTHVLRPAKGDQELKDSTEVAVVLASEERRLLNQTPEGSILVGKTGDAETVQSIIPFGKVIEVLGCTLKWTKAGFHLFHPRHGRIRTRVRAGCPEITDEGQAAAIIAELEMKKVEELKERTAALREQLTALCMLETTQRDWRLRLTEYVKTGIPTNGLLALYQSPIFAEVPEGVRRRLVPEMELTDKAGWELLKTLPLPRGARKRLYKSRHWMLNLYSGSSNSGDPIQQLTGMKDVNGNEVVVINVDVLSSETWNMNGEVYKVFLWAAMDGRVKGVLGGPPCRTFSAMRHNRAPGKPEPVRSAEHLWGLPGLSAAQRSYVDKDTELIARQLFLYMDQEVGFVMEHPADPNGFLEGNGYPSVWNTSMITEFLTEGERRGLCKRTFDQGALGHPCRKPTTVVENLGMEELDNLKDKRESATSSFDAPASVVASWAPGLRRAIAQGLKRCGGMCSGSEEAVTPVLAKLSKEQGWKLHLRRDHIPYRRDCAVCVSALGTGRPHRRVQHKSAYVMSIDIGGPMRVASRDAAGRDYRYFLAVAYTFPRYVDVKPPPEPSERDLASEEYAFENLSFEDEIAEVNQELEDLPYEPTDSEDEEHRELVEELEEQLKDLEGVSSPEVKVAAASESKMSLRGDEEHPELQEDNQGPKAEGETEVELDVLYYMKPLKRKTSKAIFRAIQEVYLQIRNENLPVVRLHSDRAHEFQSEQLKEWALDHDIMLTRTEGQAPPSNGTAERAVRYLKGQARLLLRSSGLGTENWATAMTTAAHRQRERRHHVSTAQRWPSSGRSTAKEDATICG